MGLWRHLQRTTQHGESGWGDEHVHTRGGRHEVWSPSWVMRASLQRSSLAREAGAWKSEWLQGKLVTCRGMD